MKTALEIAAELFRPTLWEPKGIPVIAAEYTGTGAMVIATGPEMHMLGTPRRKRKVYPVRTYTLHPAGLRAEEWACTGFGWVKTKAEAEARVREYAARL